MFWNLNSFEKYTFVVLNTNAQQIKTVSEYR